MCEIFHLHDGVIDFTVKKHLPAVPATGDAPAVAAGVDCDFRILPGYPKARFPPLFWSSLGRSHCSTATTTTRSGSSSSSRRRCFFRSLDRQPGRPRPHLMQALILPYVPSRSRPHHHRRTSARCSAAGRSPTGRSRPSPARSRSTSRSSTPTRAGCAASSSRARRCRCRPSRRACSTSSATPSTAPSAAASSARSTAEAHATTS